MVAAPVLLCTMAAFRYIFRQIPKQIHNETFRTIKFRNKLYNRFLNYVSKEYGCNPNPAPIFFNDEIQSLLKFLTRVDLNKVYRKRKSEQKKLDLPTYKFMDDDELKAALEEAQKGAEELLQMPPVVPVRESLHKILIKDPALQGLDTASVVFTDITFGVKDNERIIVIRKPDGTLCEANWNIRDRMNQVYFPKKGKKLNTPLMFEDAYIERLLNRKEYEFILDRACVQFEPNSSEYQKITSITYEHLNENSDFDCLRSTRHFGPLVFFLSWHKNIDNLMLELIETSRIEESVHLLKLYGKMHNIYFEGDDLVAIQEYISKCSNKKGPLELTLQAYKELEKERQELAQGINAAHGI